MRRTSIKCGESALEGIIGQYDDRRKVDAVKHPHYKAVGFLKPKIANINWCGGTAFLIGPITIVTAAHNLFLAKGIQEFYFYPSAFGEVDIPDRKIVPQCRPVKVIAWKHWKNFESMQNEKGERNPLDFAVMILERYVYLDQYPSFGFIKELKQTKVEIIGYPGEKQYTGPHDGTILQPFIGEGKIVHATDGLIFYTVNTTAGQSGSPIFARINGFVYVIGIHNGYSQTLNLNRGVHINEQKLLCIKRWRDELLKSFRPLEAENIMPLNDKQKNPEDEIFQNKNNIQSFNDPKKFFQFHWDIPGPLSRIFKEKYAQLERIDNLNNNGPQYIISKQYFEPNRRSVVRCELGNISQLIAVGVLSMKESDRSEFKVSIPAQIFKHCKAGYRVGRFLDGAKGDIFPQIKHLFYEHLFRREEKIMQKGDIFGLQVDPANGIVTFFEDDQPILDLQLDSPSDSKLYLVAVLGGIGDSLNINRLNI